jgi:hypothetical protein
VVSSVREADPFPDSPSTAYLLILPMGTGRLMLRRCQQLDNDPAAHLAVQVD